MKTKNMCRRSFCIAMSIFAIVTLILPSIVCAEIIYGITGGLGGSDLVRIDTETLNGTMIGSTGFDEVGGLAFGNDGTLYGIAAASDMLITIDTTTGAGTSIGSTGRPISFSTGLSNDPVTDTLYGVTSEGANMSSFLVTYSKIDGSATSIGGTGTGAIVGLDFDTTGQLWGIDGLHEVNEELIRIDKANGVTTVINSNSLGEFPGIGGFDIGINGTFWAVDSGASNYRLLSLDSITGIPVVIGEITGITNNGAMSGLASIPEPTTFLILGFGGLFFLKRRRA